jgi:hypothetical protein
VLKLNIELTLGADVNELALAQGLAWLAKAGTLGLVPTTVTERYEADDVAKTTTRTTMAAPPAPVQAQPNGLDHAPQQVEAQNVTSQDESGDDGYIGADELDNGGVIGSNDTPADIQTQYDQAEALLRAGAVAPALAEAVVRRRPGRRSSAEKAAAIDASISRGEEQPVQQAAPQAAAVAPATQAHVAAAIANFALPPGMSMPAFATAPAAAQPQPTPQPVARQTPAMPPAQAQPAPPANGGPMLYDDFRNALSAFHKQRPGYPFTFMRRPAWLDGSSKSRHAGESGRWLQAESVPEEFRARLLAEIGSTIGQAP